MDKKERERKGCAKDLQVADFNRVVAKALPRRCYLITVMKKMRKMCMFICVPLSSLPTSLSLSFLICDSNIRATWQSYFRIKREDVS